MRHFIIGTAGHIDHGKTSLVKMLTGIDTDRLPEEQARGMTIELGFAHFSTGPFVFSVVDVPGHERFVRTMVAGATGIDVALLVVAADDSVMPQTIEHVQILDLLGVSRGVVALTKADRVDGAMIELVAEEVSGLLAPSSLAGSPMVAVSSTTGQGLDALRAALCEAASAIEIGRTAPPFRMCIDRAFTVQGRGLVVTGSVLRGTVACGDELELWPGEPSTGKGRSCRVRQIQSHGHDEATAQRGTRAALNLIGLERGEVTRGMELSSPGYLIGSRVMDVRVRMIAGHRLKSGSKVRLSMGTSETEVRVVLVERPALEPDETAYAQLRSGEPLTATFGQRFILRDANAAHTLGGGVILRPVARRRRIPPAQQVAALRQVESQSPADRLAAHLRTWGFGQPSTLHILAATGIEPPDLPEIFAELKQTGRWIALAGTTTQVMPAVIEAVIDRWTRWMERFHAEQPDAPGRPVDAVVGWLDRRSRMGLGRVLLDYILHSGQAKMLGRFVCLPRFAPDLSRADEKLLADLISRIVAGAFSPPMLDELSEPLSAPIKRLEKLAQLAVATGQLVHLKDRLYLSPAQEQALRQRTRELIAARGSVTVSDVRETLDTSRKYCVPYMEYLDRVGLTQRVGDARILAPATP